ncbi:methyltransferase domain-containing protein [Bradyrhizobium sp. U87765 SZCCT0131]|uniref:class I SAM-dependent methyltransferase n=1 Tax=unclassified Bradyrhizobium TaxID=2631580 RepID=UPI001BA4DE3F|nr:MULTISPECIES: methyltransferase domain-containing protein [unclassified Bradyrhizobium]MBR1219342.1 methyltransferase domain-containing protein [Bradyrhizobium sp. U87765 SZCCT0131]MBR1261993.1 methyltransferase domain-containing protein [Bradyrhizobium sp. U87765 SZCCT0134]MBR1306154.1 methyltransferase domain-containing protein [Bradyrhizobium sp. U87765 SZCCT0110]MBR1317775.1 methyltransferase domain-containing protein [Bradyrhizobium sp. U87765 SZCCT0109]MBR1351477.1 methyltransferase d
MTAASPPEDIWSDWILHRRGGGDPAYDAAVRADMMRFADRALDGAALRPHMTLVGAGDGLVAFRAIERIGPTLEVILTDISPALLAHAEALAIARGIRGQCRFVTSSANDLAAVADASVDAVITRSVLAYVADKPAALRAFHRILKPGGRLSLAEPAFQDEAFEVVALRDRLEAASRAGDTPDRILQLMHRWKSAHYPDTLEAMARQPITSYGERDLFRMVGAAGFAHTHLELHLDAGPSSITTWDTFLDVAPHPLAPSPRQVFAERFTAEERTLLERALRPLVETPGLTTTSRMIYVTADKPA